MLANFDHIRKPRTTQSRPHNSLVEVLRQATHGSVLGEEAVLKIDSGYTNQVVGGEAVPVHHSDSEGVIKRQGGRQLKHPTKQRIEVVGDVVVFVVNLFFSNLHFKVGVRLEGARQTRHNNY